MTQVAQVRILLQTRAEGPREAEGPRFAGARGGGGAATPAPSPAPAEGLADAQH